MVVEAKICDAVVPRYKYLCVLIITRGIPPLSRVEEEVFLLCWNAVHILRGPVMFQLCVKKRENVLSYSAFG